MILEKHDNENLEYYLENLKDDIKFLIGSINGRKNKENPDEGYLDESESIKFHKNTLQKYKKSIKDYKTSRDYQVGEGIMKYFSPQQLIKRLELLGGSLAAGNDDVLTEYIQLAHRLRDLGIVTNNQLNKLLRNYLNIR